VKKQYDLVEYHVLPEYLRDNEYILRHYRSDWPLKETVLSIFTIHNETLNIWTHLIGFLFFLALTIYTIRGVPKETVLPERLSSMVHMPNRADLHQLHVELVTCFPALANVPSFLQDHLPHIVAKCIPDSPTIAANSTQQCFMQILKQELGKELDMMVAGATRTPFLVFMGGAMFCLLSSSFCHLLSCHSSELTYWLWRLDYAGIATMIATSFFPPVYYVFLCQPIWRHIYLTGISVIGITTVAISLVPVFQTAKYRPMRAIAFAAMGLSGIIPGAHKIIFFHHEPVCVQTLWYEIGMGLFYLVGVIIYVTRIPERWKPGFFDIAGHSHQLFHVLVIAGAYTHYRAGLLYMDWRDLHGCVSGGLI
jgi:adiponectin receptor